MRKNGAGKGGSQQVERTPGIKAIRRKVHKMGEFVSSLMPSRVERMAQTNHLEHNPLICIENGKVGKWFCESMDLIDPNQILPVSLGRLCDLFLREFLIPLGCLEHELGGNGALTSRWSREVIQLRFPSDSDVDKKACNAFVEKVAERVEREVKGNQQSGTRQEKRRRPSSHQTRLGISQAQI